MGSFKVIFVPRAEADLKEAVTFIARRSGPEVAESVGLDLVEKAISLQRLPERGRIVPELKKADIREIFFKTYRIVYRISGQSVQVLRFWHGARGAPEIDSDEFSQP